MKKLLIFFVICSSVFLTNCSKPEKSSSTPTKVAALPGEEIYTKYCKLCHGTKGDLGLSGAANLSISSLSVAEVNVVVTEGRKAMQAWKGTLTPEQIQQVSDYVMTLRNK